MHHVADPPWPDCAESAHQYDSLHQIYKEGGQMAVHYLSDRTQSFRFLDESGEDHTYLLIFGDEFRILPGPAPSGKKWMRVKYRGRTGEMLKSTPKTSMHPMEMYFLDVGQGDAAFVVTPNGKKILVDGGLNQRALGFLIWKYRLDNPDSQVTIDLMIVSHADDDHIEGLIPVLQHDQIKVKKILHNGIARYATGFYSESVGDVYEDSEKNLSLGTLHDTIADLGNDLLNDNYEMWIDAVCYSGANYRAVAATSGKYAIGDPEIKMEILGPILEPDGWSLPWFGGPGYTINGNSVVLRLTFDEVRVLFSGDLNKQGAKHLCSNDLAASRMDAHILKAPHHGSHLFYRQFFDKVQPQITVASSGDAPDYGHPRAIFLGSIGRSSRVKKPLLFSTEIAATFVDAGDAEAVAEADLNEPTSLADLDFGEAFANRIARRRFKKTLPGIINVRTDGKRIYAARRVEGGWESYGPIKPVDMIENL